MNLSRTIEHAKSMSRDMTAKESTYDTKIAVSMSLSFAGKRTFYYGKLDEIGMNTLLAVYHLGCEEE